MIVYRRDVLLHVPNFSTSTRKWGRAEARPSEYNGFTTLDLRGYDLLKMEKLPTVIVTSVVRSSRRGESHGGVYLVDLDLGRFEQVIDWNDPSISWEGRGGDRGLRGIAFHREKVYIAASDEVFVYDRRFELLESHRNKYLKHCHEICVAGDILYLTSTELNSVLEFDLAAKRFIRGHSITYQKPKGVWRALSKIRIQAVAFDPNDNDALPPDLARNDLHINNVSVNEHGILISGTRIDALLTLKAGSLQKYAPLPIGTHNATSYGDGLIYNNTRADCVVIATKENKVERGFPVPEFPDLPRSGAGDYARQSFGRGLCVLGDNHIIAGSSPSTVSVYEKETGKRLQMVNLSKDIRNCIHGLELWDDTSEGRASARPNLLGSK